ncbi:hypothetical protein OZ668_07560 [Elizabethkingia sp. HX XZB]|nr:MULTISPECIES: hypothetical protein [Elizabethkingia]MDX8567835.1 hypothetical protein [Elizabethkingia sp. HX XZB]
MNKSIGVLLASAVGLVTVLGVFGLRKLVSKHDHDDYLTDRNSQKNDEADSVELNAYL